MDVIKKLAELAALSKKADAFERELVKKRETIKSGIKEVEDFCRPVCVRALEEFNASRSLKISTKPFELNFNFSTSGEVFGLSVIMRYPTGSEPDEEFDLREPAEITNLLAPIINRHLKEAGIPLKFDLVRVPLGYYSR